MVMVQIFCFDYKKCNIHELCTYVKSCLTNIEINTTTSSSSSSSRNEI